MWRGLPISTWLLLAASVCAGPALVLVRRWADGGHGRRSQAGPADGGAE